MAGQQREQQRHGTVAPRAGHDQQSCPACGSPVDTMVGRRKSLGIFVPVWTPGPCRNRECAAYEPGYEEPRAEEPAYEEPRAEEPAYEEPRAEEPAYEEPRIEELRTGDPRIEDPRPEGS